VDCELYFEVRGISASRFSTIIVFSWIGSHLRHFTIDDMMDTTHPEFGVEGNESNRQWIVITSEKANGGKWRQIYYKTYS